MNAYYNELERFPCSVIEANIARGRLPQGKVHCENIEKVVPSDLESFRQLHLFAGIGVAAYACRLAGMPDDFSIATFGFPCQDISAAGKGEGLHGKRSGLFFEAIRLFDDCRPTWLLAENVAALRTRGIERVCEELEGIGYTVLEPLVVGADDAEAPHRRKRVWIVCRRIDERAEHGVGHSDAMLGTGKLRYAPPGPVSNCGHSRQGSFGGSGTLCDVADTASNRREEPAKCCGYGAARAARTTACRCSAPPMADTYSHRQQQPRRCFGEVGRRTGDSGEELADSNRSGWGERCRAQPIPAELTTAECCGSEFRWPARPGHPQHGWEEPRTVTTPQFQMGSATDGTAQRLVRRAEREWGRWRRDSLKALGNAWVPQTAAPILRWIHQTEAQL